MDVSDLNFFALDGVRFFSLQFDHGDQYDEGRPVTIWDGVTRSDQTAALGAPGACLPYDNRAADERDRKAAPAPYRGGYPFMALAKQHSVDYGDVLVLTSSYLTKATEIVWVAAGRISFEVIIEINNLCREPVWARGGPHAMHAEGQPGYNPEIEAFWAARGIPA